MSEHGKTARSTYLHVGQMHDLQHACRLLSAAFGFNTYLVGSVLERPTFRDVDLRCILDDVEFALIFRNNQPRLELMNRAISGWLAERTGLPIDFQFQMQSAANQAYPGRRRNFMGRPLPEVTP